MEERLQKFLSSAGVASRRKSEELIQAGRIKVNGNIITELGIKINPNKDIIEFDNQVIKKQEEKIYILLNKPIGYVTTVEDQFNRPTVMDLIKKVNKKVVPVGRLDMYTSGALLLSNDGEFVNKITHPKNEIEKTYNVTLKGIISKEEVKKLQDGVEILDKEKIYKTQNAKVKILKTDEEKNFSRIQISIHEGKNREVRKMCESIGKKVLALHRSRIGMLDVKDIKLGNWKYLSEKDIEKIFMK